MYRYRIAYKLLGGNDLGTFEGHSPVDALARMLRGKGVPALCQGGELRLLDARDLAMHAAMHYDVRLQDKRSERDEWLYTAWLRIGLKTESEVELWQGDGVDDRIWPQELTDDDAERWGSRQVERWLVVASDPDDAIALVELHLRGHAVKLAARPSGVGSLLCRVGRPRGAPLVAPPKRARLRESR